MTMKATSHLSIAMSMDLTSMAASTTPTGPKMATASTALASKALWRMKVPAECGHNAHMYYIKLRDQEQRAALISFLNEREISAVFHYIPLHSAKAGREFGVFAGEDRYTTRDSERLLRLPLYYEMTGEESAKVIESVHDFFRQEK